MTEKQQNAIDEIMDWFDFEKVAKVMSFLEWKWVTAEEGIPSVGEIRQSARKLLKQAIEQKTTIATGGLRATYFHDEYVKLEFIIEEMDVILDNVKQ
jgi:hypothetical protein